MNVLKRAARLFRPRLAEQILVSLVSLALLFATWPQNLAAQDGQAPPPEQATQQAPPSNGQAPEYTQQTPEQLQQLVAPIALYPDSLVAQILAASTFPEQVVEADRWVQAHPDLKGDDLGKAVDQQDWDPSVKALTAFPTVLGNMDKNLSWTSSLGDAYYNQQQDVTEAVQVMRQRAQSAGDLKDHAAAKRHDGWFDDRYSAGESRCGLRPGLRSVGGLRRSHPAVARLVSLPWNLVRRPVSFVRPRLRNRIFRRLWLGLGKLGI